MSTAGGGSRPDPVLTQLLLEELRRHEAALAEPGERARKAIHALKGSAGLAGEAHFAQALARIERRLAEDASALDDARKLFSEARRALEEGKPIPTPAWPEPPHDLRVRPRDPALAARYEAEARDRLERIDACLAAADADVEMVRALYREVHAMKGAALATGDEATAWFCHGLEERIRAGERGDADARRAIAFVVRFRGVLGEIVAAPERAMATLRAMTRPERRSLTPPFLAAFVPRVDALPLPPRRPNAEPTSEEPRSSEPDPSLRVPALTLDRLFERVRGLDLARAQVSDGSASARAMAAQARKLRSALNEALRLIGPPKPWGAPAAAIRRIESAALDVGALADRLEREAAQLKEAADEVRAEAAGANADLAGMRTMPIGTLLERVAAAITGQARREGREVRVAITGGETPVDRRAGELLVDPVLQLARNALVHGIEPAAERVARGKPAVGAIRLAAEARGGGLRLRIEDDGAGVDVAEVRRRALAAGTIAPDFASSADDDMLLALLFVPGFTTRDNADLLAGRGVGLDLALAGVRRLGGTIRLASVPGLGLTATLDVPLERGLVKVLWVEAGGARYAIPVQHTGRVLLARDAAPLRVRPLVSLLGGSSASDATEPAFALALPPPRDGAEQPLVGIDRVGEVEEVTLRGVSPVVAIAGPYAGAIAHGDAVRLCLDAQALAELAGGG